MVLPTGTKGSTFSLGWYYQPGLKVGGPLVPVERSSRWVGTFSPGWRYQPELKASLVPGAKNAEANAKLGHRSKVCSLVVDRVATGIILAKLS